MKRPAQSLAFAVMQFMSWLWLYPDLKHQKGGQQTSVLTTPTLLATKWGKTYAERDGIFTFKKSTASTRRETRETESNPRKKENKIYYCVRDLPVKEEISTQISF